MSLTEALGAALAALSAPGNGERSELTATQLEVAILDRARAHRTFRRIGAARLEELLAESRAADAKSVQPEAPAGEGRRLRGRCCRGPSPLPARTGQHRPWRRRRRRGRHPALQIRSGRFLRPDRRPALLITLACIPSHFGG